MASRIHPSRTLSALLAVVVFAAIGVLPSPRRAAATTVGNRILINAQGFDTCLHMSATQFNDWWIGTPLFLFGTYLGGSGGSQVGCTPIAASTRNAAVGQGWSVIPFWFGPQLGGSCSLGTHWSSTISLNTTTAYNEGVAEAKKANTAAASAGYGSLDIVYFDLEAFYAASGCVAAASAFINGWDYWLAVQTPYWPGVYGSECASHLSSYASISHVPTDIAPADQVHGTSGTTASVYGLQCLSNSKWDHHQRVRQYEDPSPQVYWSHNGSGSIGIDAECADAEVNNATGTSTITVNNCQYRYSL